MKLWMKLILATLLLCFTAAGGAGLWAWNYIQAPVNGSNSTETTFTVESGESLPSVAVRLEQDGLLRWNTFFRLYARVRKTPIQAGEFNLSPAMSPRAILETLAFGRPILHRLSFAEGLTLKQVALAVNATGLTTADRFLEACHDRKFLLTKGIMAPDAEGYLFPETYFFPRIPHQDPYPILTALLDRFRDNVKDLPQSNNATALHEMVILASLVEKETAVGSERPVVAGVYARRLQLGMLLQCDPTIIYGLGDAYDGNLRRSHLKDEANPYNTYVHPGLPRPHLLSRSRITAGGIAAR